MLDYTDFIRHTEYIMFISGRGTKQANCFCSNPIKSVICLMYSWKCWKNMFKLIHVKLLKMKMLYIDDKHNCFWHLFMLNTCKNTKNILWEWCTIENKRTRVDTLFMFNSSKHTESKIIMLYHWGFAHALHARHVFNYKDRKWECIGLPYAWTGHGC